jgi:trigger factor
LNPECTRELILDVPADEVAKAYKAVTANYRRYAKIPGFRPGKVPEAVISRRFGNDIRKEVIDHLLPERFNKAVRELGITPVGQPQVAELTVAEDQPLHVKALFEYLPDFSIDGYRAVHVPKPSAEVTEEEYKAEIDQLRDSRATIEPVEEERALKNGDWAQISYNGNVQAEEDAPPVTGEDALVEIGGKETLAAFNEALTGAKVGQELQVEVVYPADYQEPKLAGKTVAYNVTVKAIKKRILPELNDEFARELGNYEKFEDLEKRIREYLKNRKQTSVEDATRNELFEALAAKFTFPVPESLVQQQIDTRLERGLRALAAQGMSSEQMRKLDFTRLRAAQRDGALAEVKSALILDKIAQAEGLTVSEEEVDREIHMAALQSREPVEELQARLTADGGLARIREQLLREKTAHLLYERLPA